MSIGILIAEDHAIVREGLRSLIEKQPDMEIVCEAEDGRTAVDRVRELLPDVVIMDITMPNLNGVEATHLILEKNPNIRIIALSVHFDKHFVHEMLKAGASGYVLKSSLFDEVLRALRTVKEGEHYLSPRITEVVLDDYIPYITDIDKLAKEHLTERERRIIQMLAEGMSTKQIALHI